MWRRGFGIRREDEGGRKEGRADAFVGRGAFYERVFMGGRGGRDGRRGRCEEVGFLFSLYMY